jgi:hypothetical protein
MIIDGNLNCHRTVILPRNVMLVHRGLSASFALTRRARNGVSSTNQSFRAILTASAFSTFTDETLCQFAAEMSVQ